jgi:N,N'-diacetyllegionaminate synthase
VSIYVIAEIGPNHNGDLALARDMVRRLSDTGVDAVKFQLSIPGNVYSADAYKADYQKTNDGEGSPLDMARRIQLPARDHLILAEDCRTVGLDYMCTAFDIDSLRFLDDNIEMPYFKIASGEIFSADTLDFMARRDRPILLSTGMASFKDIKAALTLLEVEGPKDITILHCVSNYPAPIDSMNLRVTESLREWFGRPVGFSDHSLGNECCLAAAAMGATVLEKHVTADKSMAGPDHKASATIDEMAELVRSVRLIESALGDGIKAFTEAELGIQRMARKSIVAAVDLPEGHLIVASDIRFKRPGTGVSPLDAHLVIGKRLQRAVTADRVIDPAWLS